MSSQSDSSKTEKPTSKKILDARKEGNVARSKDLSMFVAICTFILAIVCLKQRIIESLSDNYTLVLNTIMNNQFQLNNLSSVCIQILINFAKTIVPIIILAALFAMVTTIIQLGGPLLTNKLFKFELKKFNVVENAKQIFAKKNLLKFLFNCLKLCIMGFIGYRFLSSNIRDILLLVNLPLSQMIFFIVVMLLKILAILLGVYFVFAALDLVVEKQSTYKQLMMSMDEVKREYKENEGDPEIKNKRKELHRELLEENDEAFVANKDSMLVLANPTHIAIVLLYIPQRWRLPIMVHKAKGYDAQQIFQLAKRNQIPIIRDKWLARQMYAIAEINQVIPQSMTKHIAELIAKNLHLRPKIAYDIEMLKKLPRSAINVQTSRSPGGISV